MGAKIPTNFAHAKSKTLTAQKNCEPSLLVCMAGSRVCFILVMLPRFVSKNGAKRYKGLGAKSNYILLKKAQFHSRTPHKLLPHWQQRYPPFKRLENHYSRTM